jgi:hypothetical protein
MKTALYLPLIAINAFAQNARCTAALIAFNTSTVKGKPSKSKGLIANFMGTLARCLHKLCRGWLRSLDTGNSA